MPVRDTRCIAQVGKALHDGLGAATSDAPLAQHGYFAEQVHRDFDAVKQPPLRASRTVEEAFNFRFPTGIEKRVSKFRAVEIGNLEETKG